MAHHTGATPLALNAGGGAGDTFGTHAERWRVGPAFPFFRARFRLESEPTFFLWLEPLSKLERLRAGFPS